jgi:hypothetical protein
MNADTFRQLVANCRLAKYRFLGFPRDWVPHKVRNPDGGFFPYFTDSSAWDFIAGKLEDGHPFEELTLDEPKGALAIVMHIELHPGEPLLYVKIQVGTGNKAIGRSFHYSEHYQRAK